MRKFTTIALIMALSLPSSFAFADANTAADIYRDASQAYQNGNFKEAASLLEKAYNEDQNLIYKYNQILAYMGARNHVEALRVLKQHEEPMKTDGRFDDIDEIRLQLEATIAEQEKAEQEKLATDSKVPADYEKSVTPVTPPPSTSDKLSSPNYLAWSIVGVGGATLVTSALFYAGVFIPVEQDRLSRFKKLKRPGDNAAFDEVYGRDRVKGLKQADQDARTKDEQNRLGDITLGVGIALVGTGLALWYFDIPGGSSDDSLASKKPADANALKVHITPYFSTESAGASMHLRF